MECQSCFLEKENKKNITNLLSAEIAQRVAKVKSLVANFTDALIFCSSISES